MLRILADTVGKHDMQFSPCGPEDNLIRFKQRGKRTCIQNFIEVLSAHGIARDTMNEPFGIFFNMEIDTEGRCSTHPPLSMPGDFIELEVCMDLIIGLSACPQVFNGCNGHKFTKTHGFDPVSEQVVPLYHPRSMNWRHHFTWSDDFTELIGISPTGRITIEILHLNRTGNINIRQLLLLVGLHPPKI